MQQTNRSQNSQALTLSKFQGYDQKSKFSRVKRGLIKIPRGVKGAWSKFPGLSKAFIGQLKIPRRSKVQTKIPRGQPRDRVLGIFVRNRGNKKCGSREFLAWRWWRLGP
jgi:hypothetical protein